MRHFFRGKKEVSIIKILTYEVKLIRLDFYTLDGKNETLERIAMKRRCIGCYRKPEKGETAHAVFTTEGNKIAYDCCIKRIVKESNIKPT